MRDRKEIEEHLRSGSSIQSLILEVLLDIRELLKPKPRSRGKKEAT